MPSKNQNRSVSKAEIRRMNAQRILFAIVAVILILSWIFSLIAH